MSRLPSHILVSALLRRADQAGGNGAVLARGDSDAGALVLVCRTRGAIHAIVETARDPDGRAVLRPSGPGDSTDELAVTEWSARRRKSDPDLWLIDLDVADAQRLAAETIAAN